VDVVVIAHIVRIGYPAMLLNRPPTDATGGLTPKLGTLLISSLGAP
jgi:hypothetical protein